MTQYSYNLGHDLEEVGYDEDRSDAISAIFDFARRSEEQRGVSDSPLVGELGRVCKGRFDMIRESGTAFFEYCVNRGLLRHIEELVKRRRRTITGHGGVMLSSALKTFNWGFNNFPMVEMLLECGADPNAYLALDQQLGKGVRFRRFKITRKSELNWHRIQYFTYSLSISCSRTRAI